MSSSVIKLSVVNTGIHILSHLKEEMAWAVLDYLYYKL